jgi:hypothetical protein
VHAVSGLMKMFFRELNPPLMTFDLYSDFMAAAGCVMSDIKALIAQLPAENKMYASHSRARVSCACCMCRACRVSRRVSCADDVVSAFFFSSLLGYLLHFLYDVSQLGDLNKMRPMNLAIVFSPNLFRSNRSAFEVLANSRYHTRHTRHTRHKRCGTLN